MIAEIIVDIPNYNVDKAFHYTVPSHLLNKLRPGMCVMVPFGHRKVRGYVIGFAKKSNMEELKAVESIVDDVPALSNELIRLAHWMSTEYLCLKVKALQCMLPPGSAGNAVKPKIIKAVVLNKTQQEISDELGNLEKSAPKQANVLSTMIKENGKVLNTTELARKAGTTTNTVRTLVKKGYLALENTEIGRIPYAGQFLEKDIKKIPNEYQEKALELIKQSLRSSSMHTFLIHGVTGSGKTEVYLHSIEEAISIGKDAIVLVPEISLTPQMVRAFKRRFAQNVAVLHSGLSSGQRYDEWRRICKGEVSIVVGARSAIFAPFSNLGLIVVDEEHENTYKQQSDPRYHARDVALKRGMLTNSTVVLGSATPSLETYYNATTNNYTYIQLPVRISNKEMPGVHIVDMREELKKKNRSIFSQLLYKKTLSILEKGQQAIYFLNRRGFSTFVMCRECGHVLKCSSCDVSLVYHSNNLTMKCHYCDYVEKVPDVCPACESRYIKYFGSGTQKVQEEAGKVFAGARIERMDTDTTSRKGAHERILKSFEMGDIDILIGTQMVAKGFDFPGVTLVGVIAADITLNLPDFRSSERTFQLLTQVAGRAGRGNVPGQVIIQTYNPFHFSIKTARSHDYQSFAEQELEERKELEYPPFSRLIRIVFSDKLENRGIAVAHKFCNMVKEKASDVDWIIMGPAPCPIPKIKDLYRHHILFKGNNLHPLKETIGECAHELSCGDKDNTHISIDVEPDGLL